jgi:hypothetical protein
VNLYRPPGRGSSVAIALLSIGFLLATALAVVEYVELQRARDRVEELEAQGAGQDGGLFGELGDLIERIGGAAGGGLADQAALVECLGGSIPGQASEEAPVGSPRELVVAIARQVERLRELRFRETVDATFLSSDEAAARVRELFLQDYPEKTADHEERILTALGAIAAGTDLRNLQAETLGQQVAGFYDPRSSELVIRQTGMEPGPFDRVTLAHELDHALTDQVLGLPLPDEPVQGREDRDLAALAVVEGDATLIMQRFATSLSFQEQLELLNPEVIAESEAGLGDFPPYLRQELLFPYEDGLRFVCQLFAQGGWDAVNAAYTDPPESTAQILFPDRYFADEEPVDPPDPDTLAGPWHRAATEEFGAANLLWLLRAAEGHSSTDPMDAASAWAGGQIELWTRGADSAVALALVDVPGAAVDLCRAMVDWYRTSFGGSDAPRRADEALARDGPGQDAVVTCPDGEVFVGIGPDLRTARAVAG